MSKISIIMPIYNNKSYVEIAIKSVHIQTYKNWELIIVNDKSTDGVEQILNKYVDNEKIKVINNIENVGCYISLNIGIKAATGDYIGRLDSDDFYNNNKLSLQVKILDDNPQFNIVFTNAIANKEIFKSCMATTLIRKTVFDKIGYYDSVRIAADNEYKFRYIKIFGNKQIAHIDQNLYHIRIRNNSLSRCPKTGMSSVPRNIYRQNYKNWHKNNKNLYIEFPLKHRTFPAPKLIL